MTNYKITVVGGWCGNRMVIICEHLTHLLEQAGFSCRVVHQSVWENSSPPQTSNLVLQLLPAFTEDETGCPIVNIKPMLLDLDHPETIAKIFGRLRQDYPAFLIGRELHLSRATTI